MAGYRRAGDFARIKLAGLQHEVFAVIFLNTQQRLIEYIEMFRATIDQAVYPREVVKTALQLNAAACRTPQVNREPSHADNITHPGEVN